MNLLVWKPSYSLGIPSVDMEHREMIALINQAYASLEDKADRDSVEAMLGEIHAGIAAHFALEERLMRTSGYAEYEAHKQDHERLLDEIHDLMEEATVKPAGDLDATFANRLKEWFERHFRGMDVHLHRTLGAGPG